MKIVLIIKRLRDTIMAFNDARSNQFLKLLENKDGQKDELQNKYLLDSLQ